MSQAAFEQLVDISLTVNGESVEARVPAGRHVVDFLRLDLGLTGAHAGCEHGVCGACTLQIDGEIVRGCLILAAQMDGAEIWTIEGVTDSKEITDLQDNFVERNALQCGFCTPGMIFAARDILTRHQGVPSREDIREHISGNYCRCTGYEAIVDAIETTARARNSEQEAAE